MRILLQAQEVAKTALVTMFIRLLIVLFFTWITNLPAFSEETPSHEVQKKAVRIYDAVMSPYCPGRTLSGCPSPEARDLRQEVLNWLQEGLSEKEIKERLVTEFGHSVEGAPRAEGIGLFAWLGPAVFVLIFLAVLVRLIKHKSPEGAEQTRIPEMNESFESFNEREFLKSLEKEIDELARKELKNAGD